MDLKQFRDSLDRINSASGSLLALARAFEVTGNPTVAESLYDISNLLYEQTEILDEWKKAVLDEQLKSARDTSGAMFNAVLAGAFVAIQDNSSTESNKSND